MIVLDEQLAGPRIIRSIFRGEKKVELSLNLCLH